MQPLVLHIFFYCTIFPFLVHCVTSCYRCEPWRYSIIKGSQNIEQYFDFIDHWYQEHADDIPDEDLKKVQNKLPHVRESWPYKVSHMIIIGMKRQARPDRRLPEWEEISAVAMSVQNIYLMTTTLNGVGGYWSSQLWSEKALNSEEFREKYFGDLLKDSEDRVFGMFVLGKYDDSQQYQSVRSDIQTKIKKIF